MRAGCPAKGLLPLGKGTGETPQHCLPRWMFMGPRVVLVPSGAHRLQSGAQHLLHLSGAVSWCPLCSLALPQRHGAVLEKELLMGKINKRKCAMKLF